MIAPDPPVPPPASLTDQAWRALLDDDDRAPLLLEAALTAVEPVPEWLRAGAEAAWGTRDPDGELAALMSATSTAGAARGIGGDDRTLTFATPGLSIDVTLRMDPTGTMIDAIASGDLLADPGATSFGWEDSSGRRHPSDVDRFSRFLIAPGPEPRIRLRVRIGESSVVTPWFDPR